MTDDRIPSDKVTIEDWHGWIKAMAEDNDIGAAVLAECGIVHVGPTSVVVCCEGRSFARMMLNEHRMLENEIDEFMQDVSGRHIVYIDDTPCLTRPSIVLLAIDAARKPSRCTSVARIAGLGGTAVRCELNDGHIISHRSERWGWDDDQAVSDVEASS